MEVYQTRKPWMGKGFAGVVALVVAVGLLAVAEIRAPRKWLAAAPLFALGGYVVCLFWRNEVQISVGREGIRIENGPLPGPQRLRVIRREEIARVYVRAFTVRLKNAVRFQTVGVELKDGDNLDILVSRPPHTGMMEEARRLAGLLGWNEGVVELAEQGTRPWRPGAFLPVLWFFGVFVVCVVWALLVAG